MLQKWCLMDIKIFLTKVDNKYTCQYMSICMCILCILLYVHTCVFKPACNL